MAFPESASGEFIADPCLDRGRIFRFCHLWPSVTCSIRAKINFPLLTVFLVADHALADCK